LKVCSGDKILLRTVEFGMKSNFLLASLIRSSICPTPNV
jgi:hypothetical protein